jgi:hypothetical protein
VQVTPEVKKRFPAALGDLFNRLLKSGKYRDRRAAAVYLGITHPRLIRLLNGKNVAGARTVATICSQLGRQEATLLLEAYLLDEIETVIAVAKSKGETEWQNDALVVVNKVNVAANS